jgi:hypothetical protein
MGERLTRKQAAEVLGVSRQIIDRMIGEGKLKEDRATVDSDELIAVAEAQSVDHAVRAKGARPDQAMAETLNKARTAKAVTDARRAELDFKIKQNLYVLRENVVQQGYAVAKAWSQKTASVGRRLAPLLATESDPAAIEQIVQREIDQITSEMRDGLSRAAG